MQIICGLYTAAWARMHGLAHRAKKHKINMVYNCVLLMHPQLLARVDSAGRKVEKSFF